MSNDLVKFAENNGLTIADAQLFMVKNAQQLAQVYLINGVKLVSVIVDYNDNYLLMLDRTSGGLSLVRRAAISTVNHTGMQGKQIEIDKGENSIEQYALDTLSKQDVSVFLLNGIQQKGRIVAFDENSIFLRNTDRSDRALEQIIQLSSVASVCPRTEEKPRYNS